MPYYTFECDKEQDGCGHLFEVQMFISDYDASIVTCPLCKNAKCVRNFAEDLPCVQVRLSDDQIKLGHLAHRNTERLSDDEKAEIHKRNNAYRYEDPPANDLPAGAVRTTKPSSKTYKKDPKRRAKKYAKSQQ